MIKITAIPFTGYPVSDMPRARAFYEGVLGLKPGDVWEDGGRAWVEYNVGPGTLALSNMTAEMWKPSSDGPSAALEVADFDAAIAHLRENQVRFVVEPCETPVCHLAVIHDPDGNSIAIHHKHAG